MQPVPSPRSCRLNPPLLPSASPWAQELHDPQSWWRNRLWKDGSWESPTKLRTEGVGRKRKRLHWARPTANLSKVARRFPGAGPVQCSFAQFDEAMRKHCMWEWNLNTCKVQSHYRVLISCKYYGEMNQEGTFHFWGAVTWETEGQKSDSRGANLWPSIAHLLAVPCWVPKKITWISCTEVGC